MLKTVALTAIAVTAGAQNLGPGAGPWEVVTPESQGLSTAALEIADRNTENGMSNRQCFLVAKNGKIVHERYMRGANQDSIQAAFSVTKTMCASLAGIAVEQGFADVKDRMADRIRNTLACNRECTLENVLTMTGESADLSNPRYRYDTLGTNCLNTISDMLGENNPDNLTASQWMERYYRSQLGFSEQMLWTDITNPNNVPCGFGVTSTCRDLLRAGQLWANNGRWEGAGQLMSEQYAQDGVTSVFPNSGMQYGYTTRTRPSDPVDNQSGEMNGLGAQCVFTSARHNAVIVSMGSGGSCNTVWSNTREAIVSRDDELFGQVFPEPSEQEQMRQIIREEIERGKEVRSMYEDVRTNPQLLRKEDLAVFNAELEKAGIAPITAVESN